MRILVATFLAAALFVFGTVSAGATGYQQRGHHGQNHFGFSYRGKHGGFSHGFNRRGLHKRHYKQRRHRGYRQQFRRGHAMGSRGHRGQRNRFKNDRFHYRPHGGYYYRDRFGRLHFKRY